MSNAIVNELLTTFKNADVILSLQATLLSFCMSFKAFDHMFSFESLYQRRTLPLRQKSVTSREFSEGLLHARLYTYALVAKRADFLIDIE